MLAALSLVSLAENERYRQHPLLADFSLDQLGDDSTAWGRFSASRLDFVRRHRQELDRLEPEWENTMAAMHTAFERKDWQMVLDFADALETSWYAGRATATHERAITGPSLRPNSWTIKMLWRQISFERETSAPSKPNMAKQRNSWSKVWRWPKRWSSHD